MRTRALADCQQKDLLDLLRCELDVHPALGHRLVPLRGLGQHFVTICNKKCADDTTRLTLTQSKSGPKLAAGYNTGAKMAQQVKLLSDESVGRILESARDTFTHIAEQTRATSIINWQKEAGFARQIVLRDERLLQADPESIKNAITNVAATGLTLNPVKQHAVILPRWNDKKRSYEAQLVVMYRGLMWLAGQAGVTDIDVDVVYTADRFKIIKTGDGSTFEHEIAFAVPRDGISSKFQGVYVAARMPGSKIRKVEWIPIEQIYKARDKSESYLDKEGKPRPKSPWVWSFDEMAKKVGIKVAQKRWEEAVIESQEWRRFQTAVALDNANEGVIPSRVSDIPGTAENADQKKIDDKSAEKLSMAQLTELEKLVEQIAPNTDKFPNNVKAYMAKLARLYRCNALDEVLASKFNELKDRLNDNRSKVKAKKAADKTGGQEQGKGQTTEAGKKAGGGSQAPQAGQQGQQEHSGGGGSDDGREPGSDDDIGDPDRQIP
jgi:phage RecT family recombinase